MELFYGIPAAGGMVTLPEEESVHCVRVLRHREGDVISVIDGCGTLYSCRLTDASPKGAVAVIESEVQNWNSHPYHLVMAVCPTKNIDRYEWFVEKATEIGVDEIVPAIGDRSERRVLKTERLERLVLSASKQSLKGRIPEVREPVSVMDFISSAGPGCNLICYCHDSRIPISEALDICLFSASGVRAGNPKIISPPAFAGSGARSADGVEGSSPQSQLTPSAIGQRSGANGEDTYTPDDQRRGSDGESKPIIRILIGPEGDFSDEEIALALQKGWKPVSLGNSRLRTETAAVVAATAVYLKFGES